jgi:hypothetical protein
VRRRFYDRAVAEASPIAHEALQRIARLYAIEKDIRGRAPGERRDARQERSHPIVDELEPWLRAKLALISKKSKLAEAIRYALARWEGLCRFLDDGRIEIDSNTAERSIRPLAKRVSLYSSSLCVCKHWKRVHVNEATRAAFPGHRRFHRLRHDVRGPYLMRRPGNHLYGGKHAGLDQAPYRVACDAQELRRVLHGDPFAVFFRGSIGMDAANASNRSYAMRRPGLALARGHSHSIKRRGNMFVGPAASHAAHDRQRVFGRGATMFASPRLADT